MTLASMTGFGRAEGDSGRWSFVWELRSVNGKGLDLRPRLPSGIDGLDQAVRSRLQKALSRGNVSVNLQMEMDASEASYRINEPWLETLRQRAGIDETAYAALNVQLLAIRGVVEPASGEVSDEEITERDAAILTALDQAVAALVAARGQEGARLQAILLGLVEEFGKLVAAAADCDSLRPEARRERLQTMLAELLQADPPVNEDRLAQELALQMTRGDITEELDRLRAHVQQAAELLNSGEPVGRRLDFLAQEFNREANTLCSKSGDIELTRIGMDLKVAIDRFREQVQNVE